MLQCQSELLGVNTPSECHPHAVVVAAQGGDTVSDS